MNNKLTVLIGESENVIIELITEVIDEIVNDICELVVLATPSADELLLRASDHNVDLFVLTLNNIRFPNGNIPGERRIEQALCLVSDLRNTFQKPIIALAGWPDNPGFADRIILAGADRFYKLPVKLDKLRDAIRDCLGYGVSEPQ